MPGMFSFIRHLRTWSFLLAVVSCTGCIREDVYHLTLPNHDEAFVMLHSSLEMSFAQKIVIPYQVIQTGSNHYAYDSLLINDRMDLSMFPILHDDPYLGLSRKIFLQLLSNQLAVQDRSEFHDKYRGAVARPAWHLSWEARHHTLSFKETPPFTWSASYSCVELPPVESPIDFVIYLEGSRALKNRGECEFRTERTVQAQSLSEAIRLAEDMLAKELSERTFVDTQASKYLRIEGRYRGIELAVPLVQPPVNWELEDGFGAIRPNWAPGR